MIIKSMIGNQNPFKNKKKNFKQPHKQSNDENGAENAWWFVNNWITYLLNQKQSSP